MTNQKNKIKKYSIVMRPIASELLQEVTITLTESELRALWRVLEYPLNRALSKMKLEEFYNIKIKEL